MITSLTDEQKRLMPEFVEKWTRIGLSTEPADRPRAEAAIKWMYSQAKLEEPRIVWCGSPLSNAITYSILKSSTMDSIRASVRASVGDSVGDSVMASVRASVWASVRASVMASVGDSVMDSVRASVWASVRASVMDSVWASVMDSVRASVMASVWASVMDSVRASVWASVGESVRASVRASVYGQHEAGWLSFYDYFRSIGLTNQTNPLHGLLELAQSAGWAIPLSGLCLVSERHSTLRRNSQGRLHYDGGPSIEYPDGWQIHALNGVRVSKEYAETLAERLDPHKVITESNAEVRRELIRKVGIERLLSILPTTVIDTKGTYELLRIKLSEEVQSAIYLKMINPSVGCFHVEGVDPSCKSVQEAINWRADQPDWSPEVVT